MNSTGKKIIAVCALALIIVIISAVTATGSGHSDSFSYAVNYITQPVKSFAALLTDKFASITEHITDYDKLVAENEQLKAQIDELQDAYLEYQKTAEENERLHNLLNLSENNPDYTYVQADIIAWTGSSWTSSFTINSGASSDISLNDCVVDEYGRVVGLVTAVSESSSVVTTILDTTSSIGAKIVETDDNVIASGRYDLFPNGNLELTCLPDQHEIVSGYVAVTSGTGGACPAGLLIGTVSNIEESTSGLDDYAVIQPATDFDSLSAVFVIISY